MPYLLDTNTCLAFIDKTSPALLQWVDAVGRQEVALSAVSAGELATRAANSPSKTHAVNRLDTLLAHFRVLPFDLDCAKAYGAVRARLEREGKALGALETLIAAHALSLGRTLVTEQTAAFEQVQTLAVLNASAAPGR